LGKHKTLWQIVCVVFFLFLLALAELERAGFLTGLVYWWGYAWIYAGRALIATVLILTTYSGLRYLWNHRELFLHK